MKIKRMALLFSIAVSAAVLSMPLALNTLFFGDDLYDAVLAESLGVLPVSKAALRLTC